MWWGHLSASTSPNLNSISVKIRVLNISCFLRSTNCGGHKTDHSVIYMKLYIFKILLILLVLLKCVQILLSFSLTFWTFLTSTSVFQYALQLRELHCIPLLGCTSAMLVYNTVSYCSGVQQQNVTHSLILHVAQDYRRDESGFAVISERRRSRWRVTNTQ